MKGLYNARREAGDVIDADRAVGQVRAQFRERAFEELREFGGAPEAVAARNPGSIGTERGHDMVEVVRVERRHAVSDYPAGVADLVSVRRWGVRVDEVVS